MAKNSISTPGVRLDVDLGILVLDPADEVDVIVERQLVVQAADDVQLGRPPVVGRLGPLEDLGAVHDVGALVVEVGPEGAEVALVDADVGRVDVRVDVVVAEVAVVPLADQVGHRADREQVVRRLQRQAVLEAQPLPRLDLLPDRRQPTRLGRHRAPTLSRLAAPLATRNTGRSVFLR